MGRKIKKLVQVKKKSLLYRPTYKVTFSTCNGKQKSKKVFTNLCHPKAKRNVGPTALHYHDLQDDLLPVTQVKDQRSYLQRKAQEVAAWEKTRQPFLNAAVEMNAPCSSTCFICQDGEAFFRCRDCIPLPLCYTCIMSTHILMPLHIIEKWITEPGVYWPVELPFMRKLTVPESVPPALKTQKSMTLIDEKGRTHYDCQVTYANRCEQSLGNALIKLGFWPLSPCSPNIAISINLLKVSHSLTLECQTSCRGFIAAIERTHEGDVQSASKLRSIARGECVPEFRLFCQAQEHGPITLLDNLKGFQSSCPSCPKGSADGELFLSMDANFGLVHKTNSGQRQSTSTLQNQFFLDQEKVDAFVDTYYQDTKDNAEICSQFQAAAAVRSKNKAANLNITGVFGSSCRHEIPQVFMDVRHGERLAYPVIVLQTMKERCGDNIRLKALYDIACTLKSHLKKRDNQALLHNIELAIPVFHAYGHKGECQITMNPRRMTGFGLVDGEQMERLWSYLRLFAKITKEQTPGHRKELLTMALLNFSQRKADSLEGSLLARWKKAESGLDAAEECFTTEMKKIPDGLPVAAGGTAPFINGLKAEETAHLKRKNQNKRTSEKSWKQAYAKELLRFYTLRSQLHSDLVPSSDAQNIHRTSLGINQSVKKLKCFEKKHKVDRWLPTSEEYVLELGTVEDTRRQVLLQKLQGLAVEKEFFLELRKKYSEGQAVAQRLAYQLVLICRAIRVTITSYNIGNHHRHTSRYPTEIKYDQVTIGSDLFNILEDEAPGNQVPFSVQRKLLDQWEFKIRCQEEMGIICTEMRYTYMHYVDLHDALVLVLEGLEGQTSYEVGLHSLGIMQLYKLEARLQRMYDSFKEYTGIPPPPKAYVPRVEDPMVNEKVWDFATEVKDEEVKDDEVKDDEPETTEDDGEEFDDNTSEDEAIEIVCD